MLRDVTSRFRISLLTVFLPLLFAGSASAQCFDVRVEFRGRVATQNIGGVQFYSWTYRVYGNGCINRALGHWALGICPSTTVSGVSTQSIDATDAAMGMITNYLWTLGKDPPTLLPYSLKWDWVAGNQVDKLNEYDEFSFIASGPIVTINWAAKAAPFVVFGTTQGPGCAPVPTQLETWGGLKARYR
jgi:hypothetical protein